MLKLAPLLATTVALTLGTGIAGTRAADSTATDMCYGCCSNNMIWLPCCTDDPEYERHALPCFAWGAGVMGPCHGNCVWGGCSQHDSCGGEEEDLREVLQRMELGDVSILAEIRGGAYKSVILNEERRAIQVYSSCGTAFPRLVGHLPLNGPYNASSQ